MLSDFGQTGPVNQPVFLIICMASTPERMDVALLKHLNPSIEQVLLLSKSHTNRYAFFNYSIVIG